MRVDGRELRLAFEQQQQVGKRSLAGLGLHALVQRLGEGEIVRRIHGQARGFVRELRIGCGMHDAHEIGVQLEIARHMLARDRIAAGLAHQFLERAAGERVHAFMRAQRARIGLHIIPVLRDQRVDHMVDEGGV